MQLIPVHTCDEDQYTNNIRNIWKTSQQMTKTIRGQLEGPVGHAQSNWRNPVLRHGLYKYKLDNGQ